MEIYCHIPFCKRKCYYCDFCSQSFDVGEKYFSCLEKEIILAGKKFKDEKIETIFFGGGTPSAIQNGIVGRLMSLIEQNFDLQTVERTIEGNPESLSEEKLVEFKKAGFDRLSIGVQSFDDGILKNIGRLHNGKQAKQCIENACKVFSNVSIDLMIGLPNQTYDILMKTFDEIQNYDLKHISCYQLKVEEGTRLQQQILNGELTIPNDDEVAKMYEIAVKELQNLGFVRYEVSNFAKQGFESQHNLGYWQRKNYLGFGVSAHSMIDNVRFSNFDEINQYEQSIEKANTFDEICRDETNVLKNIDIENEKIMLGLRLAEGIDRKQIEFLFQKDPRYIEFFENKPNNKIALNDRGVEVMNSILCEILKF